jgi:hypothetical protein
MNVTFETAVNYLVQLERVNSCSVNLIRNTQLTDSDVYLLSEQPIYFKNHLAFIAVCVCVCVIFEIFVISWLV